MRSDLRSRALPRPRDGILGARKEQVKSHRKSGAEIPADATWVPPSAVGHPRLPSSPPPLGPKTLAPHPPKSALGQRRRWALSSHSSKVTTSKARLRPSPIPFLPFPLSGHRWQLQSTTRSLLCLRHLPARHHQPATFQPHTRLRSQRPLSQLAVRDTLQRASPRLRKGWNKPPQNCVSCTPLNPNVSPGSWRAFQTPSIQPQQPHRPPSWGC